MIATCSRPCRLLARSFGLGKAVGLLLVLVASTARGDIIASSTFDTGLDGWSGLASQGPVTQYSWGSTGGDPGGYFDFLDQAPTTGTITAPSQFLGNWLSLNGSGSLTWDQILFSTGGDPSAYGFEADISGPGGSATFTSTANDSVVGSWISLDAPINSADWTVNSGSWTAILANVTSLNIVIEDVTNIHTPSVGDPGDHDGIDNVFLTSSVPEPNSLALAGLGLACLLGAGVSRGKLRVGARDVG